MQIETFECAEVSAEPVDATDEAIQLMESLGLEGQRELVCPSKAPEQSTRWPFREMLADELFAYKRLCPKEFPIEKYRASAIPLRVLQVAGMARMLMPDCKLIVWDREEAAVPDPVLVCHNNESEYSSKLKRWIIARWGTELEALPVLLKKAVEDCRAELLGKLDSMRKAIESASAAGIVKTNTLQQWEWKL